MTEPHKATILVIDDEEAIRQSFTDYLEDLDYRILAAENGRIGVDIFEREKADLILVDLRMPEMDGLEVLAHITRVSPDTPLVVVSGTGVIADAVEALHHGAWDYMLKPIQDLSELTHVIELCLEKAQLKRENRQYQRHLEAMVAERTQELQQTNEHLACINARLERIVATTQKLSFCDDVTAFGAMLLDEFGQHMMATGGSLYFKEADGLHLVHALDPGHAPDFIPFPIPENTVFQKALAQTQPILIEDIASEPNLAPSDWEQYMDGSVLVFPLPDESGNVSALLTLHSKEPPPFVEQDREIGAILISYSCEALRAVQASDRLRENEQGFRLILDNIQTGIVIIDVNSRDIVYANPSAEKMAGASPGAILGRQCDDVLSLTEMGDHLVLDSDTEVDPLEQILKTSDGREMPILTNVNRTVYRGRNCLLASFLDLSAQKLTEAEKTALETQLRQSQKMEALGTLAGGIAHDFNNILGAIIGYAELCYLDLDDPNHPSYPKLKSILHAGSRAKDLVSQILAFSRMQEHILTPVSIAPIMKEALKLLAASLPASIELEQRITSEKQVLADPTQIHQVIMNLCTNAYHAMEIDGGRLTVSLESILKDGQTSIFDADLPPGAYLALTVADTGSGIRPSVLNRIFDPYFTTKSINKGTGLGLAVVHGIVTSHGGLITVDSQHGEGTTVRVFLPTTDEDAPVEIGQPTQLPYGTEKILLVDDEKDLVDIGCQMLDMLGYEVTGVVGSVDALEAFERAPQDFDLVITDLNMPGMPGNQLAEEMLRVRSDIPIIICTGFSERFDQKRALRLGVRKLIMKPLVINILAGAIREVLDESQELT